MRPMACFSFFLLLFFLVGLAEAGDEVSINQGLQANAGGVYTLPAGTYTISDQIIVPEGTTFQGEVSDKWGTTYPKSCWFMIQHYQPEEPLILNGSRYEIPIHRL